MSAFAPLVGQAPAVELLTQAVAKNRVAPAYLFTGAIGVGRSLAATCLVELLFSPAANLATLGQRIHRRTHPDLLWVEPTYLHQGKRLTAAEAIVAGLKRKSTPVIRLEQIRQVTQFLARSPLEAPQSIVVIEQAETMAEAAANGLLKTLESPGQATIILLAPNAEALLPTLVSRCQTIPFYRLNSEAMAQVLHQVGQAEILSQSEVMQLAQGSPGAAIAHWQQLQAMPADLLTQVAERPRSPQAALTLAREIEKNLEPEAQLWLIDYLQQRYWQRDQTATLALHQLEQARQHLSHFVQPRLVWEVTLLQMVA
jgi:DNA polymerase-3 subunit delta'